MADPASQGIPSSRRWDAYVWTVLGAGFLFALFFLQNLPYWDDDYTSWFQRALPRSFSSLLWELFSPVSSQLESWGFEQRTVQCIVYKLCYTIAGHNSWPYLLFRCACYAGLGLLIYFWVLRLIPETSRGKKAAFAAAMFVLVAPGPVAALVWLADFAPAAEFAFLLLTLTIWTQVEQTPIDWDSLLPFRGEKRRWLLKWIALSFAVYLGYKTKADLKLIPVILGVYLLVVRRRQWKLFVLPEALMLASAVPWSPGIFRALPPFLPGSAGSASSWMWQPASTERLREFIWSSKPYDLAASFKQGPLSLAGVLGPFLLIGAVAFLFSKVGILKKLHLQFPSNSRHRARMFAAIWFGAMLVGVSALPVLNDFFRIRYGILTIIPAAILLGWLFGSFAESTVRLPRWLVVGCLVLAGAQTAVNISRSTSYRRDLGTVMVAVDAAYGYVNRTFPDDALDLMPDFLSYEYRLDASQAIRHRTALRNARDLPLHGSPNRTSVLSWRPSLWEQLDTIQEFRGCRTTTLFDLIVPCPPEAAVFLMRWIGPDSGYQAAEAAEVRGGGLLEARRLYDDFLNRHPANLAARLKLASTACRLGEWATCESAYARVQEMLPTEPQVLYNRSVALIELHQDRAAIELLKRAVEMDPRSYDANYSLYSAYLRTGQSRQAEGILAGMKRRFQVDDAGKRPASPDQPASGSRPVGDTVPGQPAFPQATAEDYLNLSLQYYRVGRYDDSIAASRQALKLKPDYAEAYNNIAAAYQSMSQWDAAIEAAQQALRLKPDFVLARNNLAWSLAQKKLNKR